MTFLQSLFSQHSVAVIVAAFTFISLILSGVAAFLKAIGDQVPGWLGSVISFLGSVVSFLNGHLGGPGSGGTTPPAA